MERQRIAAAFLEMMLDKGEILQPHNSNVEEKPIPKRMCSEANLLARSLLNFKESEDQKLEYEDTFTQLPDGTRNKQIEHFISGSTWANLELIQFDEE